MHKLSLRVHLICLVVPAVIVTIRLQDYVTFPGGSTKGADTGHAAIFHIRLSSERLTSGMKAEFGGSV